MAKKQKIEKQLRVAQSSTASMGKFDSKAHKLEKMKKIKKKTGVTSGIDAKKDIQRSKDMLKLLKSK